MTNYSTIDIKEDVLNGEGKENILKILLFDRTSRRNIIWACDDYLIYGEDYSAKKQIYPDQIIGLHGNVIQPRVAKSKDMQTSRTRNKAEVFTPTWICNEQNNLVDAAWFGREDVFNHMNPETKQTERNPDKIQFPDKCGKTWKKYVDINRMEITCGEAPYLVNRYDAATGNFIPIVDRIGILDRKLRVVNENTDTREDWLFWTLRAFQSVYGFEFQGDNLLLARENLFATFMEYFMDRFEEKPTIQEIGRIPIVITWNIWQMDGLTGYIPYGRNIDADQSHEAKKTTPENGNDIDFDHQRSCVIQDWRSKTNHTYLQLMRRK